MVDLITELTVNEKIAIIVSQFKEEGWKVLSYLEYDEQQEILREVAKVNNISQGTVDAVIDEFLEFYIKNSVYLQGGTSTVHDILVKLYGEEKAHSMLAEIMASIEGSPLQSLKKIDTESLINFVRGAHPQIIATLLSYLNDDKKSAAVLSSIDKSIQNAVVIGMASMENGRISEDMLETLEEYVNKTFASSIYANDRLNKIGGINTVVRVMNSVDMVTEKSIMDSLEEENPLLAEEIKKKMFIFDDFIKLQDRDIKLVVREIQDDNQLAICLKYSDKTHREELIAKFLNNMSSRKAEVIRESIALPNRIKKADLEEARQVITGIAKRLHENGEISLGNSNDEFAE